MGWLDEAEYEFQYRCPDGHLSVWQEKTCDKEPRDCLECGVKAEYLCFVAQPMLLRGRVAYEQNGRKALRITDGKGGVRYTSVTKENYLETGDVKPAYTSAYQDHLIKTGKVDQLIPYSRDEIIKERAKKKKAKVSEHKGKDAASAPGQKKEKAS